MTQRAYACRMRYLTSQDTGHQDVLKKKFMGIKTARDRNLCSGRIYAETAISTKKTRFLKKSQFV